MRRVIVISQLSLDGVIQAPGAQEEDTSGGFAYGGWAMTHGDEESGRRVREQLDLTFDLLLGRKTYDIWASYWPNHGDFWPNVNSATKYVTSNTVTSGDWQPSVFLGGDVASKVADLKHVPGPDLHVYGSSILLQTLMAHDLVDAYWLRTYPVTLGSGKRLFAEGTIPAAFRASGGVITPSGVVFVDYERAGAVRI